MLTPSVIIIPGLSDVSVWTASSSPPMAAPASVSAANSLRHSVRVRACFLILQTTAGKSTAA